MSPPLYMSTLLVLLALVCYGSALRVRSYRCTPLTGRNDPACSRMRDIFTCATNGGVVPYLSDGVVSTRYLWQGSSYLDLDIPNSVCLEAVVMTFARQSSTINLPTFTIAQSTTVNTTYPPGTIAVGNTTITFAQQYCQPTIRINMTQAVSSRFTVLYEVFLIQPVDPSNPMTDPPTTVPPTEPLLPASASSPSTTSKLTSAPTDSQSSSALRVSSYRCPLPVGSNDPACSRMGDVFTCATNGGVVPYLSDGDVSTQYFWRGSLYLDLDIPNSVCLEAIVMTFRKQTSPITLTTESSITFTTTYPPGPTGIGNTTITFAQQYCQPTIRINMRQADPILFIILLEVLLIQPVDPSNPMTDPPTTMPPTEPASSSTASTPSNPTSAPTVDKQPSPGATSAPADLTIPLVAGMVVAGVVIIILLVVVMVIVSVLCILLKRLKASPPSDTKDSVIYDHVDQDPYSHVKMDKNPVYETTGTAVVLNNNPGPAYEKAGVEETNILA